jgi:hypothetical protein
MHRVDTTIVSDNPPVRVEIWGIKEVPEDVRESETDHERKR